MKNKGYTLIELIGTIVLIAIIVLLITPAISNSLKTGVKNAHKQIEQSIILAAKNYFSDNKDEDCVELSTLQSKGYIDEHITNPEDNTEVIGKKVTITKEGNKKSYSYTNGKCSFTTTELVENVDSTCDGELVIDPTEPGRYIYRGKEPCNYLTLGTDTYRIMAIENDGTLKVVRQNYMTLSEINAYNGVGYDYDGTEFDLGYRTSKTNITSYGSTVGTRYSPNSSDYCYEQNASDYYGCKAWGSRTTTLDSNGNNVTTMPWYAVGTGKNLPTDEAFINIYLNGGTYDGKNITGWIDHLSYKSLIATHSFDVGTVSETRNQTLSTDASQAHAYTWRGKIGFITPVDYVKANSNTAQCGTVYLNSSNGNYRTCINTTYFEHNRSQTLISPRAQAWASAVWYVGTYDYLTSLNTTSNTSKYPSFYLASCVKLSGSGTSEAPYIVTNSSTCSAD